MAHESNPIFSFRQRSIILFLRIGGVLAVCFFPACSMQEIIPWEYVSPSQESPGGEERGDPSPAEAGRPVRPPQQQARASIERPEIAKPLPPDLFQNPQDSARAPTISKGEFSVAPGVASSRLKRDKDEADGDETARAEISGQSARQSSNDTLPSRLEQSSGLLSRQTRPLSQVISDSAVRVAILLPLTGNNAPLGETMLRAAQMALFDVADERFVLLPYDTAGDPEIARRVAQMAIDDGVGLILGPVFSASVRAVGEVVVPTGLNILAFSTDRTVGGNGVYLLGSVPRDEVNRIATYAMSQNYRRIAVLAPDSPYGSRVIEALQRVVPRYGGTVTRVMRYNPEGGDYASVVKAFADYDRRRAEWQKQMDEFSGRDDEMARSILAELERLETFGDLPFDAVFLPEGGDRLKALAPLLAFYDVDPKLIRFLGTAQWDDPALSREPALIGGWYAAPPPQRRVDFIRRFEGLFGRSPPRLASLAYDAVALAAILARQGRGYSTQALTARRGFAGVDGIFRLEQDGLAQRGLAVLEISPEKPQIESPAPLFFPDESYEPR